jgi:tetratricopeptide (TPR) repeat protein
MLDWTQEGIRQYEQYGDRRNSCSHSINVGFGYIESGMYEEAEQALRSTLVTAEQMGLDSVVAAAKQNLGLALAHLGRPAEALSLQEDAIEAFHVQKRPRMEDGSRIYLAHSLARAGRLEEAVAEATRITRRTDLPPTFRSYALAVLAHIELLRDQKRPALEAAREAHELLVSLGGIDEGESLVRLVWAEALFADGQETSARAAIADAAHRLEGRAARMTNPVVREAFLTQIPENAMTVELAAAWAD